MITLAATTQDGLESVAKEYLEDRGWVVTKWLKWETPTEICSRLGIHSETLRRRLGKRNRPRVEVEKSFNGRILHVCSNELFDAFLTEGKK
jgi:hypothetical protein